MITMTLLTTALLTTSTTNNTPQYTPETEMAIGQWLQAPMLDHDGPVARVGLAAYHQLGIERVEFFVSSIEGDLDQNGTVDGNDLSACLAGWNNDGQLLNTILGNWGMTSPVLGSALLETTDPATGEVGYFADIDTALLGTGRVVLSARLVPEAGIATTLTGDPLVEFSRPGLVMFVNDQRPIAIIPDDYPSIGEAFDAGYEHIQLRSGGHILSPISNYRAIRPVIIEGLDDDVLIIGGSAGRGSWIYRNLTFRHAAPEAQEGWLGNNGMSGFTIWDNCTIDGNSTAAPRVNSGSGGPVYFVDCVVTNHFQFYAPRMAMRTWFDGILGDVMKSGRLNIMSGCRLTRHGWKGDHGNEVPEGTTVHSDFWQSNYVGDSKYSEENIVFRFNEAWDGSGGQKFFANFSARDGADARLTDLAFIGNALSSWAGVESGDGSGNALLFSMYTAGENMIFAENILFGQCAVGGGADPADGFYYDTTGDKQRKWTNVLWKNNYRSTDRDAYVMPTIDGPKEFFFVSHHGTPLDFDHRFQLDSDTFPYTSQITGIHYVNDDGTDFAFSRKQAYLGNSDLTP